MKIRLLKMENYQKKNNSRAINSWILNEDTIKNING